MPAGDETVVAVPDPDVASPSGGYDRRKKTTTGVGVEMPVSKHDIEWLIQTLEFHEKRLPEDLVNRARQLIAQSQYRKSVCVIHPVDEAAYSQLKSSLRHHMNTG